MTLGVLRPVARMSKLGLPRGSFSTEYDLLNIHTFVCSIRSDVYHHGVGLGRLLALTVLAAS